MQVQEDIKMEKKVLDNYRKLIDGMQPYQCYYCHNKVLETEAHWDSHMKRCHKEEVSVKEAKMMYQIMQNTLLQQ